MLQNYLIDVAIPHQSQIGFEEPICDSFPPGEAFGSCLNCKINYNLNFCRDGEVDSGRKGGKIFLGLVLIFEHE